MRIYRIQAIGPHPARYRGIAGESDAQAIKKAQDRHVAAGFPLVGHTFKVTDSFLIVCSSAAQQPADSQHELHVNDGHLAEIEMALLERINLLEQRFAVATQRCSPALPAYAQHLKQTRAALVLVMSA